MIFMHGEEMVKEKLEKVNAENVNEGVFIGPQIRELSNLSFFLP